uniref:Uncharacterized protein n=1 Tax=Physcomitrium patens TaxID=3218 RepID=A0A2K1KGX4_PHYPA|nr:hypothetical protein PHYPA_009399 [Physcomitrium patens]PNR53026.1 hypothetical protein PHYPA_009401 [Physcomitrium patens]PNR53027.1 hypothetical protein PHYPA_009402 [Physcomitrium patens]PNR53030.1 hypothetical protein PHYPA_009405 [Physcomitrium patens]
MGGSDRGGLPFVTRYLGRAPLAQTRDSSSHHFVKPEGSTVVASPPAYSSLAAPRTDQNHMGFFPPAFALSAAVPLLMRRPGPAASGCHRSFIFQAPLSNPSTLSMWSQSLRQQPPTILSAVA